MTMKKFKVRMNCISFEDIVVLAENEQGARALAEKHCQCPQADMEFGEFLNVEDWDKVQYEDYDAKDKEGVTE